VTAAGLYDLFPILVVLGALAAMAWIDAAERRANRRWAERQQAAARQRDPDRAAWDDIVNRLTREDRKP
jgi:cob(I)alamin adenosyltransferase